MSIKNNLKKLWKDSVWSKIIATILTPYIILVIGALKSIFTDDNFLQALTHIFNFGIPLWIVILIFWVIGWGLYALYKFRNRKQVIHYKSPFITFKNESTEHRYCANCWENEGTKVQLNANYFDCFECPKCHTTGNFSELSKKHSSESHVSLY